MLRSSFAPLIIASSLILMACGQLVPEDKSSEMTVVNQSAYSLLVDFEMADVHDNKRDSFVVDAGDSKTHNWTYHEYDSGTGSAWQQQLNVTVRNWSGASNSFPLYELYSRNQPGRITVQAGEVTRTVSFNAYNNDSTTGFNNLVDSIEAQAAGIHLGCRDQCSRSGDAVIYVDPINGVTPTLFAVQFDTDASGSPNWQPLQATTDPQIMAMTGDTILEGSRYQCNGWHCRRL